MIPALQALVEIRSAFRLPQMMPDLLRLREGSNPKPRRACQFHSMSIADIRVRGKSDNTHYSMINKALDKLETPLKALDSSWDFFVFDLPFFLATTKSREIADRKIRQFDLADQTLL